MQFQILVVNVVYIDLNMMCFFMSPLFYNLHGV